MSLPVLEESPPIQLCTGIAELLAAEGLADWRPTQLYGPEEVGVFLLSWPNAPDRIVSLNPYAVRATPGGPMQQVSVQVRCRWAGGKPRAVVDFAGAILEVLHSLEYCAVGAVRISQSIHRSGTSLGQDGVKRWAWADNYDFDLDHPRMDRS